MITITITEQDTSKIIEVEKKLATDLADSIRRLAAELDERGEEGSLKLENISKALLQEDGVRVERK